jgi:hypothetical protein
LPARAGANQKRPAAEVQPADQLGRPDCHERLASRRTRQRLLSALRNEPDLDRMSFAARSGRLSGDASLPLRARNMDVLLWRLRQNRCTGHPYLTTSAGRESPSIRQRQTSQSRHAAGIGRVAPGASSEVTRLPGIRGCHDHREPENPHRHDGESATPTATPRPLPPDHPLVSVAGAPTPTAAVDRALRLWNQPTATDTRQ